MATPRPKSPEGDPAPEEGTSPVATVPTPVASSDLGPAPASTKEIVPTPTEVGAASAVPSASASPSPGGTDAFPHLELAQEPPFRWPSPRAPVVMFLVLVLLTGVVYPGAMTLLADEIAPVNSSELFALIGENISNPALFWERPSQINWSAIYGAGSESPYGPTNPLLLNQTEQYIQYYGLGNVTVPLDLVSPSASGLDPDIYPDAALVQVPRVVHFSNLSLSLVWGLVNASITPPAAGIVGPYYVNVILLDQAMLLHLPPGTPVVEGSSASAISVASAGAASAPAARLQGAGAPGRPCPRGRA